MSAMHFTNEKAQLHVPLDHHASHELIVGTTRAGMAGFNGEAGAVAKAQSGEPQSMSKGEPS